MRRGVAMWDFVVYAILAGVLVAVVLYWMVPALRAQTGAISSVNLCINPENPSLTGYCLPNCDVDGMKQVPLAGRVSCAEGGACCIVEQFREAYEGMTLLLSVGNSGDLKFAKQEGRSDLVAGYVQLEDEKILTKEVGLPVKGLVAIRLVTPYESPAYCQLRIQGEKAEKLFDPVACNGEMVTLAQGFTFANLRGEKGNSFLSCNTRTACEIKVSVSTGESRESLSSALEYTIFLAKKE